MTERDGQIHPDKPYRPKTLEEALMRAAVGLVFHPIAVFKVAMSIGTREEIGREIDRALTLPQLPRFPIGRKRFHR